MLKFSRAAKGLLALLLIAMLISWGGSQISQTVRTVNTAQASQPTATPTQPPIPNPAGRPSTSATPVGQTITTVFVIVMENHNWADIYKNPSAPYINNTLLPMASYARQY